MNIQRLPEYVLRWTVILGGLAMALFLAKAVGDGKTGLVTLVMVFLAVGAATLAAKSRIWLAIPIAWGLSGRIPALNLPFAVKDLVIMWVFVAVLIFQAFKVIRRKPTWGVADFLSILMLFYLVISWIRNPVGVEALNSDRVGGRPYFDILIAVLAYYVLSRSSLTSSASPRVAVAFTLGRMFDGIATTMLAWIPQLGFLTNYYSATVFALLEGFQTFNPMHANVSESAERLGYLGFIGYPLLLLLAARYPLTAFLNLMRPWRIILLITGVVCILLSGFRSALIASVAAFLVAAYLRKGWNEVIRIMLSSVIVYGFVAVGNGTLFNLPRPVQRSLSWLPGNWDAYAKLDAEGSTRWRTEMWEIMLTTNMYIDSHTFGDGFGFKRRDLERMIWLQMYGNPGDQENFMLTGGVHSGPVSAIRYVGYVGLALQMAILIALAIMAWRLCRKATRTPHELFVFIICIPTVIEPLYFALIFGAFENSAPNSLFVLGLLKMFQNSFADAEQAGSRVPLGGDGMHPAPSGEKALASSV